MMGLQQVLRVFLPSCLAVLVERLATQHIYICFVRQLEILLFDLRDELTWHVIPCGVQQGLTAALWGNGSELLSLSEGMITKFLIDTVTPNAVAIETSQNNRHYQHVLSSTEQNTPPLFLNRRQGTLQIFAWDVSSQPQEIVGSKEVAPYFIQAAIYSAEESILDVFIFPGWWSFNLQTHRQTYRLMRELYGTFVSTAWEADQKTLYVVTAEGELRAFYKRQWKMLARLPMKMGYLNREWIAATANSLLYVFHKDGDTTTILRYDPRSNYWTDLRTQFNVKLPRYSRSAIAI